MPYALCVSCIEPDLIRVIRRLCGLVGCAPVFETEDGTNGKPSGPLTLLLVVDNGCCLLLCTYLNIVIAYFGHVVYMWVVRYE